MVWLLNIGAQRGVKLSGNKELSEAREKHINDQAEIKIALKVDGSNNPFDAFDDDIFLLDYWSYEQGINYLAGIADVKIQDDQDGSAYIEKIITLDYDFYLQSHAPHIINAFKRILIRLRKIWHSGGHPDSNPPWYYIEWAISKKYEIPWLAYAIEKGFYVPKENDVIKQVTDKPLSDKERETLLIIIAALAKEAKVDISKTSKAGDLIANMTQLIGAPVGATTIETHLKKIPQALENRAK